jgi:hypothetical protein
MRLAMLYCTQSNGNGLALVGHDARRRDRGWRSPAGCGNCIGEATRHTAFASAG